MTDPNKVACLRCHEVDFVYTVPLHLPASEAGWQSLCAACFRQVLRVEPNDELGLQPVKRPQRGRRR